MGRLEGREAPAREPVAYLLRVYDSGCMVSGGWFRVQRLGFRVGGWGLGFRVSGLGSGVEVSGLRVQCLGCRVQYLEFRISGFESGFWG